ncbi:MAG: divergent polysaccharide deacetylase family protein [Candidatus Cloacimonetes bacterium]|nr:divergent polysaccharide deacetylase family protein [Candidatus Cloacimonadota bacterium]
MPKTIRKPNASKRHKIKKIKRRRPHLGLFLVAGITTALIMWALIREPMPAPQDLEQIVAQEIIERTAKPVSSEKRELQDNRQTDEIASSKPATGSHETAPKKEQKPEPDKPKPGESELDLVVRKTSEKLGVPISATHRRKVENIVCYSLPIDRSQMDLTYANMIFKGAMEHAGAALLEGKDNHNKHSLAFTKKGIRERYELDIYYDSSVYQSKTDTKTITIVIDDFGAIDGSLLDGFFELDPEICFAIFPDEKNSESTMHRATAQGRETIIHVPMEPIGYPRVNPGSNAILVQHSEEKIAKILDHFKAKLPDCIGINNHMGSLATTDPDVMQAVMNALKKHDMLFLDSRTTNVSIAYQTAQKSNLKTFRNDIFLDSPNISQSTMEAKLNRILELASVQNHVIAITHCHNSDKLDYLKSILKRLKKAGFTLVPLSQIGERNIPEIL